jgi:solute carrier family 25 phosphate transporter 23/24/25/41
MTAASSTPTAHHEVVPKNEHLGATFAAGGIAGMASRTATAPLDRIKTLVQEGKLSNQLGEGKQSIPRVMRSIYADSGVVGFWRGNGINCLKAGPEFAMVFGIRSMLVDAIAARKDSEELSPNSYFFKVSRLPRVIINFSVGALAGAGAQTILYPAEVIKTRYVVSKSGEFKGGIRDVVSSAYRQGGVAEFYRGLVPNMVGILLYRGLEVGAFYTIRQSVMQQRALDHKPGEPKPEFSILDSARCGTISSIFAQTATYPLNVVRTRLQTQGVNGRRVLYSSMTDCFGKIFRSEGVAGLYGGLLANFLKAVPAGSITFVVYEQVEKFLTGQALS